MVKILIAPELQSSKAPKLQSSGAPKVKQTAQQIKEELQTYHKEMTALYIRKYQLEHLILQKKQELETRRYMIQTFVNFK